MAWIGRKMKRQNRTAIGTAMLTNGVVDGSELP